METLTHINDKKEKKIKLKDLFESTNKEKKPVKKVKKKKYYK